MIGMNDPDILHSICSVKEMIYSGYSLNDHQEDAIVENSGVLSGKTPYIDSGEAPKFHVPKF
jgi:hypothetical protein